MSCVLDGRELSATLLSATRDANKRPHLLDRAFDQRQLERPGRHVSLLEHSVLSAEHGGHDREKGPEATLSVWRLDLDALALVVSDVPNIQNHATRLVQRQLRKRMKTVAEDGMLPRPLGVNGSRKLDTLRQWRLAVVQPGRRQGIDDLCSHTTWL